MPEHGGLTLKTSKILVLGTGAWGTALASVLYDNHHQVMMYGVNSEQIANLKEGKNPTFFGDLEINFTPTNVSSNLIEVIPDVEAIIFAFPTSAYADFVKEYQSIIPKHAILIIASKGMEPQSQLPLDVFLKQHFSNPVCLLLGPGFAKEVIRRQKTCINVISEDNTINQQVATFFNNENFLVYPLIDTKGADVTAAFKNALAILFGCMDGLHISINTKAAILSLALKEIKSYLLEIGANPDTINELCGIGDIYLTCCDNLSRNYQFGMHIAQATSTCEVLKNFQTTVEGYKFIIAFFQAHPTMNKKMIIFNAIYQLVQDKLSANDIIEHIWSEYAKQSI